MPEGTVNWLAGSTDELQPGLPETRHLFFRQSLNEEATERVLQAVSYSFLN